MGDRAFQGRVAGVQDLIKRMQYIRDYKTLEHIVFRSTFGAAKDVKNAAIVNAHGRGLFDSGALLRNIAMKRIRIGRDQHGYTVGVRAGTPRQMKKSKAGISDDPFYWWFLEFGTMHMDPKPFLGPAFKQLQSRSAKSIMDQALREVLKAADSALKRYADKAKGG